MRKTPIKNSDRLIVRRKGGLSIWRLAWFFGGLGQRPQSTKISFNRNYFSASISLMDIAGNKNLTDSPCVGICSATALGDPICMGCGRTFREVIDWNTYTDEQKTAVNLRLQAINPSDTIPT